MNQKDAVNDIKERLGEYTRLLREIDNQYERLGLMEMTMAAPPGSSMTGMPRGSGTPSDRTGLMVMRKMELEKQIKETIKAEIMAVNKHLPVFKQIRNIEIEKNEFEKTTSKKIIRYKV